jgi:hypothetical protein
MTIDWSVALRNARLDAIETAIGVSARLRVYSGAKPANCAAALAGNTLLVDYVLASDWAGDAVAGVKTLSGLPISANGAAAGNASFYRFYASDGTTCHEQGDVTVTGGGGDMTINNISIGIGQVVRIIAFGKTESGAGGVGSIMTLKADFSDPNNNQAWVFW